jgi:hypothetical protein
MYRAADRGCIPRPQTSGTVLLQRPRQRFRRQRATQVCPQTLRFSSATRLSPVHVPEEPVDNDLVRDGGQLPASVSVAKLMSQTIGCAEAAFRRRHRRRRHRRGPSCTRCMGRNAGWITAASAWPPGRAADGRIPLKLLIFPEIDVRRSEVSLLAVRREPIKSRSGTCMRRRCRRDGGNRRTRQS